MPLTDELSRWAADAVPGLPLEHERDKFLCYARAHGLTNVDWAEALKFQWLEAHARAVGRGTLQHLAAPGPAPAPESPPLYDAELHAQMHADIARLCGSIGPSILGTNDGQSPRRRHTSSSPLAADAGRERDPAYLAQMRARKAVLQAQAVLLQAQERCLEAVGAADQGDGRDTVVENVTAIGRLMTTLVKAVEVVQPFFQRQLAAVVMPMQG